MKVGDEEVRAVIADLRAQGARVSGARVRRELAARFGTRGGVERIYRLLREAPTADAAVVEQMEAKLAEAQGRAERAEAREDAHQLKWAREVDALRQRVKALEQAEAEARRWQDAYQRQAIELKALEARLARG